MQANLAQPYCARAHMYELKKRGMYGENDANEILVNNFAGDLFLIYM